MPTRTATVQTREGPKMRVQADLFYCDNCSGNEFLVYQIGKHLHIECISCSVSYCDNSCDALYGLVESGSNGDKP